MSHKVVILKTKATSLKQAEQFLRNRQWQIISCTNLRDAIAAVIQKQPEFIMIAADHPNRKVRVLPKLMGQAFPVKVVGFVEASTNASMAILHEMGLEYNVFPPVSGPAIERTILKIKKDEERKESEKLRSIENGTYMPDSSTGGHSTVSGENFSSAREMLAKLANGDDDNSDDLNSSNGGPAYTGSALGGDPSSANGQNGLAIGGSGSQSEGGANFLNGSADGVDPITQQGTGAGQSHRSQQGREGASGPGGFIPGSQGTNDGHSGSGSRRGENDGGSWIPSDLNPRSQEPHAPNDVSPILQNPYASSWDTNSSGNPAPNSKDAPGQQNEIGDNSGDVNDSNKGAPREIGRPAPGGGISGSSRGKKEAPIMEHSPIDLRKKRKTPTYKQDPSLYPDKESIIVKGTQQALDESVVGENDDELVEVKTATNVACITISSVRFSGYLIAALGADRHIDQEFLKTVQDRLFGFLRANGEVIKDDDGMSLKLEQVDFEDWAIAQADFLRKSIHGSDEIAMAFFPSKETSTKLEESVSENMLKLGIDELKDDVPVEFDLYIYLPTNQKYLLYTPQGRKLFGQQRGRLRDKGVTHMHLRKDSAGQVKRYRAQVYLNGMIEEFKNKPKVKKAS